MISQFLGRYIPPFSPRLRVLEAGRMRRLHWKRFDIGLAALAFVAAALLLWNVPGANAQGTPPPADCVSDDLLDKVRHYYDVNRNKAPGYGENWKRVLIAFGDVEDSELTPFTAAEARESEQRWSGWKPVREALECIEAANAEPDPTPTPAPTATPTPAPAATPEISIASDGDITEGGNATFTVSANPTPSAALSVSVTVSQSGDYGATTGAQTVSIPTSGSYTLTVATSDDSADEADGSVTATLNTGPGYTVSSSGGAATVAVSDDDVPEISIAAGSGVTEGSNASFTISASPTPHAALSVNVSVSQSGDYGATTGVQTVSIPTSGSYTLTVATSDDSADEADGLVTATVNGGTGYTVSSSSGSATVAVSDDDDPPAQPTEQTCNLPSDAITVAEVTGWRNEYSAATHQSRWNRVLEALGEDTGSGELPMTAAQARDIKSQINNSRWDRTARTLEALEQCAGSIDGDSQPATPEISIASAGDVTEGSDASFTITASPAPAADLTVSVSVTQSGDYGATTGARTVSIPTSGSYTLTVATSDDSADEADGSVTATLNTGPGYTVSSSGGAATVAVSDDDVPEISIASAGDVTEGSDASFTITTSPSPHAALSVNVSVSQSGDYGATTGVQTVSIPTSGSYTLTVATSGDSADEADGSVTATLNTGTGYTVSSSSGSATVAVSDDDDPPAQPTEQTCNLPSDAITVAEVTGWRDEHSATTHQSRWNRVLEALGEDTGSGELPMTAAQARDIKSQINNSRWDRTARTLEALEQCAGSTDGDSQQPTPTPTPAPTAKPEISVVGSGAVTEGGDVTFTVTANPAPTGTIAITFVAMITQDGRFTSSDGQIVEVIGPSGSNTITVSTLDDDRDEPDGSLTLTLQADTRSNPGYTVSAAQGAATVVVTDDDAPGSGSTPTYTEFWAPYQDLIAKVEAERNHPLFGEFSSHTDLYDSVLLALGQDVAKESIEPYPAWRARALAARSATDIWDEIAPVLDAIFHNGPPPAPMPTLDNPLPTSINMSISVEPTQLTLTDYFGHETDADLTFTVTLDNPIATISQWDELISIKQTSSGNATLTVTASDGTNSISATASVEAQCNPGSRLSSDGTFCIAAQLALAYNGTVSPHPSSPNGPTDNFIANVRLKEGTSGTIEVRVWVNKPQVGNSCRMRGYITIEPQTPGATIPTGVATNTWGTTSSPHASHQGWLDSGCSNGFLTFNDRNYRRARITYNLTDDGTPGTTLNGAKLVYHDVGASGTSVVGTYDLVNINFRDSIATVTVTGNTGDLGTDADGDGDGSTFTIKEGTSGTQTVTLSGEHLIGYLAPRMQDIRKGGSASAARMNLEHGHAVYWQPSVCAFKKPANAGGNTANRTATCEVSWDWLSDGSNGNAGTVKLVWHETDGVGWDAPDVHTTEVSTITMADTGIYHATNNPKGWKVGNTTVTANVWLQAVGGQNTTDTPIGRVTTIKEGDEFDLNVISGTRGGKLRVALEVRTATNDDGTQWSAWQNLDQEVGHLSLAIGEEAEWHLYTGNFVECFTPGGYNCFGGDSFKDGPSSKELQLTFVSHDDNFVYHPERYYQFRAKDSSSTKPNPILKVVEDDAVVFTVYPQQENGRLRVHLAKKVWTDVSLQLDTDSRSSAWNNWVVVYDAEATNDLDRSGSKIIDQGCDGGTSDIRVWGHILVGLHSGVPEYVDHNDGRDAVDKNDDRKGEYVLVKC